MNELCSVDFYDRQCVARIESCSVEWNKEKKVRWAARNVCEIFDTSHRARCWSRVDISTSLPHSVVSLTRCHMCPTTGTNDKPRKKNETSELISCTRNCAFEFAERIKLFHGHTSVICRICLFRSTAEKWIENHSSCRRWFARVHSQPFDVCGTHILKLNIKSRDKQMRNKKKCWRSNECNQNSLFLAIILKYNWLRLKFCRRGERIVWNGQEQKPTRRSDVKRNNEIEIGSRVIGSSQINRRIKL